MPSIWRFEENSYQFLLKKGHGSGVKVIIFYSHSQPLMIILSFIIYYFTDMYISDGPRQLQIHDRPSKLIANNQTNYACIGSFIIHTISHSFINIINDWFFIRQWAWNERGPLFFKPHSNGAHRWNLHTIYIALRLLHLLTHQSHICVLALVLRLLLNFNE